MQTEAMVLDRHGGPEVLERRSIEIPPPGPREVRVRVHAVIDMRPQPALPSTFMRASGMTLAPTASGQMGVVNSRGGTLIYWRED